MKVWWGLLLLAVVLLGGCGGGREADTSESAAEARPSREQTSPKDGKPRRLDVGVETRGGPTRAALIVANELGYFADVGLDIEIYVSTPIHALGYVRQGAVQFGVTHLPQVVLAREEGAPVVVAASLIPAATAAMIWRKSAGIRGMKDLKGKTIGIPGLPFQRDLLESVLTRSGLTLNDVRVKAVGYGTVPALVSRHVDALFGGSRNVEGAALAVKGLKPVVTPAGALGVPDYDEMVLAARSSFVARNPKTTHDFRAALARGATEAIKHPDVALKAIEETGESDVYTTRAMLRAEVAATTPLLSGDAYSDPKRAERLVAWMHEEGMIKRDVPVAALLANTPPGP